MCELALFPSGIRWVLVDDRAWRVGEYGSQAEALDAAADYVREQSQEAHVLINERDGEWREAVIETSRPAWH